MAGVTKGISLAALCLWRTSFIEGKVMKNSRNLTRFAPGWRAQTCPLAFTARLLALVIVLSAFFVLLCGCGRQLGETRAEAHRRHVRNERIKHLQLMADVDAVMLDDEPSKLTKKRIP